MQEPIFYCSKSRWAAHFRSQDTRLQTSTCTETQKDPHYRTLLYMATFTLWRHRPFQNITMCTNVTSQCVQKSFCERWCNILSIEASYLEKLFSPTELYPVIKNMHLTRPLKTLQISYSKDSLHITYYCPELTKKGERRSPAVVSLRRTCCFQMPIANFWNKTINIRKLQNTFILPLKTAVCETGIAWLTL